MNAEIAEKEKYDEQGRLIFFRTKQGKGVLVFRQHDIRDGIRVYRDYFTYAVKRGGKRYYFSLSSEKTAAAKLADEIAAFMAVKTNTIQGAIAKFAPGKHKPASGEKQTPTVGELNRAYGELASHLTQRTIHENTGALRRIAAYILGMKPFRGTMKKEELRKWREKVESLSLSRFTPVQIAAFRGSMIKRAGSDEILKGKAIVSANSYIRNAGCILAPKMRKLYSNFDLPDPCPFRTVGQLEERPHRYESKMNVGELVASAKIELEKDFPADYVVFVLSLFAGLRRKEIDWLLWEQIDFEKKHIWIRTTQFYRPKSKNSEDRIDCVDEVFTILEQFKPHSVTPPFVIPGSGPEFKIRCRQTYERLYAWLHKKGVTEVKALHTLRKEAGSYIYLLTGSTDKAADFLRNDPRTAREYYVGRKERLEVKIRGL